MNSESNYDYSIFSIGDKSRWGIYALPVEVDSDGVMAP